MERGVVAELDRFLGSIEVDRIGVVRLEDYSDTPMYQKSRQLLPGAKSVIVLALEVFTEVVKYLTSKRQIGEIALRDLYNRNKEVVDGRLDWEAYRIVKKIHSIGFTGLVLPAGGAPYDHRFLEGALSYGHAAQAAGLGIIGWHSMLITPEYGARIRLALVLTDAPLTPQTSTAREIPCVECGGACIKICPAKAITKPQKGKQHNIDKYACSSYLSASVNCAECLKVCPAGKAA